MKTIITTKQAMSCLVDGEPVNVAVQTKHTYIVEPWDRNKVKQALQVANRICINDGIERLFGFGIVASASENAKYDFFFLPTNNDQLLLIEQEQGADNE